MIEVTEDDVKFACNSDQLSSGIKAGIEGAIHSTRELFNNKCDEGFGLLLNDAENAFNTISRAAALWNARVLWCRCSHFLFNSYRGFALLIIPGTSIVLLSKEGVTQGVPSAMKLYSIGLLPLTLKLKDSSAFVKTAIANNEFVSSQNSGKNLNSQDPPRWTQSWYADDSACISSLEEVLFWMKLIIKEGPKYGYNLELTKCHLVVAPQFIEQATCLFSEFGVNVVQGQRFLGGFVGAKDEANQWASEKIESWVKSISILAAVAKKQPQAAYVAVSKSLQNEWNYMQRVFPGCEEFFYPL